MKQSRVELWLAPEPQDYDPAMCEGWLGWLSNAERARMRRYVQEADRMRFLLSRALMRSVLGEKLGVGPSAVRFSLGVHGKPALDGDKPVLRFNLSHTRGMVILGVSDSTELGVDVEAVNRRLAVHELAQRYFSAREFSYLQDLQGQALSEAFFSIWTLKEAWLKAKGLGLRVPLDAFTFVAGDTIVLECDSWLQETPENWCFNSFQEGDFRIALACWNPDRAPLEIELKQAF